jgi:hypothetical protein
MKETVGLRNQLAEMLQLQDKLEPSLLYADSTQAITQAQKPAVERKAKHWDISLHKQREFVEQKQIQLTYVETRHMLADGLTKPLPGPAFQNFLLAAGMTSKEVFLRDSKAFRNT